MKYFPLLLRKEIKTLFSSKSSIIFLILNSMIIGYGFATAVALYTTQSAATVGDPLYAGGFEPVPGIFLPAFGGIFVIFSFFLPLVIIPLLSSEKQNGTLTLLAQLPFSYKTVVIAKTIAGFTLILSTLLLTLPSIAIWHIIGGHTPIYELALLLCGYFMYGCLIVSISLFSAAIFNNIAAASIAALSLVNISLIIDFGKEMNSSTIIQFFSSYTITHQLKFFENGIVLFSAVMYFFIMSFLFLILTYIFLKIPFRPQWKLISLSISTSLLCIYLSSGLSLNSDVSESRRNSFPSDIVKALKKVPPIKIDVYLTGADSRFKDYRKTILEKLLLIKNDIKVKMIKGKKLADNYGIFVYRINGLSEKTYSNRKEEIFPMLIKMAKIKYTPHPDTYNYPGYPLLKKGNDFYLGYIYYLIIPIIILCSQWLYSIRRKKRVTI